MAQVAILGYGNIGSGVIDVLEKSREQIAHKVGEPVTVKYILDIRDLTGDPHANLLVKDIQTILEDAEVSIVVETMGGVKPAYDFVKRCLLAGKHVATSNKELVAKHGAELLAIAKENNVSFLFEASVGGGIPIIRPLNNCITGDSVKKICGILNGTTNYMLTKMGQDGVTFEEALKEAQELGFAERNPEADIEGYDACRKIAILCSLAFGKLVNYEDIATEGITQITDVDMEYASKLGRSIKLLAVGYEKNGRIYASVSPQMIPFSHPLASVNGVLNGIMVSGDVIGDLMFYGAGAGKLPTASAVVADVVEEAMNPHKTMLLGWTEEPLQLADQAEAEYAYFIRLKKAAEGRAETVFGSGIQVEIEGHEDEFAYVTGKLSEGAFAAAAEQMGDLLITRIRMA